MASRETEANKGTKKKVTKRQKQKRKIVTLIVEVVCLLVLLVVLYAFNLVSKVGFDIFGNEEAGINEDLADDTLLTLKGYTNIAIFGLDNRSSGNYSGGNSDVIMIASIDNQTKDIKLVSVYRDTYLSVGDGKYNKANSAYARGGAKQAVQMLNSNLDLDITEYVCVDWGAVIEVVDALGGVEIEVESSEVKYLNQYVSDMAKEIGSNSTQIKGAGKQTLNGAQATAYARIRYTAGSDFKRSSRQRIVLEAMLNKAKDASLGTLLEICNAAFDDISTSLELSEILGLAKYIADYSIVSTTGFPFEMTTKTLSGSGSTVIPVGLEDDVTMLHEYLFETDDYEPSATVKAISDTIITKTGVTADAASIDVSGFNNTAGQDGTAFEEDTETEE